jgi:response regulator RpfG family c-di-GMP phosphodiesterase
MTYKLMIVDDEMPNLRLLERLLRRDYHCLTASSGAEAMQLLQQHDVAILITDQRMPQMTGIELLRQTAELRPHMVRILLTGYTDVEALVEAINCGLVYMYLTKPWNNDDLKLRVSRAAEHYEGNKKRHALELANKRLGLRLQEMKFQLVSALGEALRAKDEYAYGHASRVGKYAAAIGKRMELGDETRKELWAAAALHNIGHIGTLDKILQKSGSLTSEELAVFQAHAERGARILSTIAELRDLADLVRRHQENFDGTGQPGELMGEQIPLACRVIRVAEAYDSLTQPRDPSRVMSHDRALDNLLGRVGTVFDPRVVQALAELNRKMFPRPPGIEPQFITESLQLSR